MGRWKCWDPNLGSRFATLMSPSADFQLSHEQWGVLSQLKRRGVLSWETEGTVQVNVRWEPAPPWHLLPLFVYTY